MKSNHIAIVGAGFSGAVIAYHLARAGHRLTAIPFNGLAKQQASDQDKFAKT